jgi:predicted GH43/DUF377 family glycosyl hydrolase
MFLVRRSGENPVLKPNPEQSWEAQAVFNGCPIKHGEHIHLLYRALSLPHYHITANIRLSVSEIGIAESLDGVHFQKRKQFIRPEQPWEQFGCEDPRATKLHDRYYIFYTALSNYPFTPSGIRVGVAITKDLEHIDEKHLVTPFNAKAMALFPERVNGKLCAILTANTDLPPAKIALAYFDKEEELWSDQYWKEWYSNLSKHTLPLLRTDNDHVEAGAPPIKTDYGWLIVYSYIKNYFSPQRLFTIEAALLDLKDPSKIIGRTYIPLLTPEESYELYGLIPNVIFPSGGFIENNELLIYYGAADTTCCLAKVSLPDLLDSMLSPATINIKFEREKYNPIITPNPKNTWEAKATFNPAALYDGEMVHLIYRAMSKDNTSVFGYVSSRDGIHIDTRSEKPVYVPREPFEKKKVSYGNSGCEDPRITKIGETIYMCYTAFDGVSPPRVALTLLPLEKFKAQKWEWSTAILISPPNFDNKDACIFPEKVDGKYLIFHRMGDDIDIAPVESLDFDGSTWLEEHRWLKPRTGAWDSKKVGICAPPVKTSKGWILLYHGISDENIYRVGAVFLDLQDPTKILGRSYSPLFEPETSYEKEGEVANVVFPCGNVVIDGKLFIYYGAADKVIGVASIKIDQLLSIFTK